MKSFKVGYIKDRQDNFKECFRCSAINWYENESCVECSYKNFTELTKYTKEYLKMRPEEHTITV